MSPPPSGFGPIFRDFRQGNTGIPWCQGKSHKIKGSFLDGPQNMGVLSQVGERAGGCVLLGFPSAFALASPKWLSVYLYLHPAAAGGGAGAPTWAGRSASNAAARIVARRRPSGSSLFPIRSIPGTPS